MCRTLKVNSKFMNDLELIPYHRLKERTCQMCSSLLQLQVLGIIKKPKLVKAMPQISAVAFSRKQKAILLSLVISDTNGIDILFDAAKATRTVEEYANWGIEEIESELKGNVHGADTITKMSSLMKETINEELSKKV